MTPDKQRAWFAINVEPQEIKVRRIWEIAREAGRTIAVYDFFFCRTRPAGDWGWIPHVPPWEPDELPPGLNVQGCPVPSGDRVLQHLYLKACLLARRPTDLTLILAIETDAAGHMGDLAWLRRWHPELFVDDPRVPPAMAEDPLTRTWKEVDAALGLLWRNRPPGSHLIICSDHGFGVPLASRYQALIGAGALEALGLDRRMLEDRDEPIRIAGQPGRMSIARRWAFTSLPVAHFQGRDEPEQAWLSAEQLIVRGPRRRNQAWREQVEEALVKELGVNRELLKLTSLDSRTLLLAPDVEKMGRFLLRRQTDAESRAVNASFQSGDHHAGDDGIILIAGPKVRPGALIDNARLADVTPTALYLLGLPVARDLDGRVLSEALNERALRPPLQYIDTYEKTPVQRDPLMLDGTGIDDPGVDPQLVERLRSLGYLQ